MPVILAHTIYTRMRGKQERLSAFISKLVVGKSLLTNIQQVVGLIISL